MPDCIFSRFTSNSMGLAQFIDLSISFMPSTGPLLPYRILLCVFIVTIFAHLNHDILTLKKMQNQTKILQHLWANYSDLSRGHLNWCFSKGIPSKIPFNSGLRIIVICPDTYIYIYIFLVCFLRCLEISVLIRVY